jgi:hypothetical protein
LRGDEEGFLLAALMDKETGRLGDPGQGEQGDEGKEDLEK